MVLFRITENEPSKMHNVRLYVYSRPWFDMNYIKPNPDKWHLLLSESGNEYNINIGNECITNSACEKNTWSLF